MNRRSCSTSFAFLPFLPPLQKRVGASAEPSKDHLWQVALLLWSGGTDNYKHTDCSMAADIESYTQTSTASHEVRSLFAFLPLSLE